MSAAGQGLAGEELLEALESGVVRVAEPSSDGRWLVHAWVKEAILDIFREDSIVEMGTAEPLGAFRDKVSLPARHLGAGDDVRMVPGGSSVRRGAHLAAGCVLMPPCYVNIGAHVGPGTMIDSHALVGSCAQVGAGVHVAAGAQIGGVLEPIGARPVIVEEGVLVGGQSGLYEGVMVRRDAVIAAGVILTSSTRVYDLVAGQELPRASGQPLEIPARAVVIAGSRPIDSTIPGLNAACALIVKYRDESTDAATALEEALR